MGASAVFALRKLVADSCTLTMGSDEERKLHYAMMRSIYQAHAGKSLGTIGLVSFLNEGLHSTLTQGGCRVSNDTVQAGVKAWTKTWFRGLSI